MNSKALLLALLVLVPLAGHAKSDAAAEVALVTGSVTATGEGGTRSLGSGDKVYAGDTISVSANSYCNLHFADGGRVLLRPGSEFLVEAFKYAEAAEPAKAGAAPAGGGAGEAFFKLLRGGFRAISGLIGKTERANYRVTTPVATIGIRGTDYEVQVCEGDCPTEGINKSEADGTLVASAGKVQLADASGGQQGVVVATNEGSVVLKTPKGEFAVDAGHVALTIAGGQVFMLPAVPDVMLRNHTPSPEHCK